MFLKKTKSQQKQQELVSYINKQRRNGFGDIEIREKMEAYGHTPEMLNNYFTLAEREEFKRRAIRIVSPLLILLLIAFSLLYFQGGELTGAAITAVTGSATARGFLSGLFTSYECGDDYPADSDYVMDLSECASDEEATNNNLFCYLNNTISINSISPNGSNDDWYLEDIGVDLAALRDAGETTIDSMELFGAGLIYPWNSEYDNVDCVEWNYGTTRDQDWHLCNETESNDELPSNLVFYFADFMGDNTTDDGYVTTELYYNSSYYLCYDELNCTSSTTECDEDLGWHCIGRVENSTSGVWHACDSPQEAPYYLCCKSGCENPTEMICGEQLSSQDRTERLNFTECVEDGTYGCCDDTTDCVYDGECYDLDEIITYTYETLGVGGTDIEGTTTTYIFVCSEDNHWCPENFEYQSTVEACNPKQESCYHEEDETLCNSIFGVGDIDTWEADTGCVRPNIEGPVLTSTYRVFNESCLYTEMSGMDFYFYYDIYVDR